MGEGANRGAWPGKQGTDDTGVRPADPAAAPRERKGLATGTLPVQNAPLTSRTVTLDDPLTTSLLAEISRRSRTIEVTADQIAEAQAIEPDDAAAGERDPFAELEAEMAAERGEAALPPPRPRR